MRLDIIAARLPRLPFPRLEDIGEALMAVPNPHGHTFESYLLQRDQDDWETEIPH